MSGKLLIDAHYKNETRIAVIDGCGNLNNFETEYVDKKLIKGNIYLAKVERIEQSLQAAFIDYGDNKHGFLPFAEIQTKCYSEEVVKSAENDERHYKIQDVIFHNQVLLVQAIREKRGNKCATFSTFLNFPGRYCVLVSNPTGKPGGISKKIEHSDKDRLREIVNSLQVPDGMGVIIRTAGENRTKQEIKRDFEYAVRLWNETKDISSRSDAPFLIHEEGNIVKRAIRDLYHRDMDGIIVQGYEAYKEAKTFMKIFTPSHCKKVEQYDDKDVPVFHKYGVEDKIGKILETSVTLPSGGSIVINTTEALTAIDINSGRMKREKNLEETAIKTNLEAAEEIARQIQLRDIAGLIVIDFIDMASSDASIKVEKKFKECIGADYSNIQIGKISRFGLLEISRQRLRQSLADTNLVVCKHCNGSGKVLSNETVAMSIIRKIEGFLIESENNIRSLVVEVASGVDLFVLNRKRDVIVEIEKRFDVSIEIVRNHSLSSSDCRTFVREFKTPEFIVEKEEIAKQSTVVAHNVKRWNGKKNAKAEVATDVKINNVISIIEHSSTTTTQTPETTEPTPTHKKRRRKRKNPNQRPSEVVQKETTATTEESASKGGWLKKMFK